MDLRSRVNDKGDRGLISIALDPQFAVNRRLYLLYTRELHPETPDLETPAAGSLVRVEVTAGDPPTPKPGSEKVLLSDFKNKGGWHSVAGMEFDWRGRLIVGLGDGQLYHPKALGPEALVAQDLDQLNGKILRLDPATGDGVPENPWFDAAHPHSARSRVIAYGIREPFRLFVDASSKHIYVGDVGSEHYEEIDVIPPSVSNPLRELNFGWPCYEGAPGEPYRLQTFKHLRTCVALAGREAGGAVAPEFSYHFDGGEAIVLGPRYPGGRYPDSYDGKFFVADYSRDSIWTYDGSHTADFGSKGDWGGPGKWGGPVDLELTPQGTLAYAAIGPGTLFEITYAAPSHLASELAVPLGGLGLLLVAFGAWTLRAWPRLRPAGAAVTLSAKGGPVQGVGVAEPESAAVDASYARALVSLERRRDFRMHLFLYVAWTAFLAVIWVVSEHERTNSWPGPFKSADATVGWNPWIAYPVFGWGLIVAFHAFVTYRQPVTRDDVEHELLRLRGGE